MTALNGLVALVTGGSRGLGLLLAGELAAQGCRVTIAARDRHELAEAAEKLRGHGAVVRTAVCDVRDREQVRDLVTGTARAGGGLDVVVGNAGIIQVGPVTALDVQEFRDAMDSIYLGALHVSLEALPHLRRSAVGGRLALIGSIGGLLAVPHLLPYSCAKAAVATLAEGLHEEEAVHGVSVTAVHPGLMRTGSHLHARFAGNSEREFAWFAALAGLPLLSMNAERAAERIVRAVARRRPRVVLTPAARAGARLHGVAPVVTTRLNKAFARRLPQEPCSPNGSVSGSEADAADTTLPGRARRLVTVLNERAADRLNQRRPRST